MTCNLQPSGAPAGTPWLVTLCRDTIPTPAPAAFHGLSRKEDLGQRPQCSMPASCPKQSFCKTPHLNHLSLSVKLCARISKKELSTYLVG